MRIEVIAGIPFRIMTMSWALRMGALSKSACPHAPASRGGSVRGAPAFGGQLGGQADRLHAAGIVELPAEVLNLGIPRGASRLRGARLLDGRNRPGVRAPRLLLRLPVSDRIA